MELKYKLAIVGSRSVDNYGLLQKQMRMIPRPIEIISGGAKGADALAERYAQENGIPITVIRPDWDKYGKSAGFKRNVDIIEQSNAVLVLWDGDSKGALHDINIAIAKRKHIKVVPCAIPSKPYEAWEIRGFDNEFRWLSNMWPAEIELQNGKYASSENAYQALKFTEDFEYKKKLMRCPAIMAKQLAREYVKTYPSFLAPNFMENRYLIMKNIVREKFFQNSYLGAKLMLTGDIYLEETNNWGDTYFGVCNEEGENNLGKILMEVRSECFDFFGVGS